MTFITGFATVVVQFVRYAFVLSAFSVMFGSTSHMDHAFVLNLSKSMFVSIAKFDVYGFVTVNASLRFCCVSHCCASVFLYIFDVVRACSSAFSLLSCRPCVHAVTKRDSISLGIFTAFDSSGSSYLQSVFILLYSSASTTIFLYSLSICCFCSCVAGVIVAVGIAEDFGGCFFVASEIVCASLDVIFIGCGDLFVPVVSCDTGFFVSLCMNFFQDVVIMQEC